MHQQRPRFAPRFSPAWHSVLLPKVFSTISKGTAHLQIKTSAGAAAWCPGWGWNMIPMPHSDLPDLSWRAGLALLGLAQSTLSLQRSPSQGHLPGRSRGNRTKPRLERLPPTATPSCCTSLEEIPHGAGCPALARGSLSRAMQIQLPRLSVSPAVAG